MNTRAILAAAALASIAAFTPRAFAQTIAPAFADNYALTNYGRPAGLPGNVGGILFDGPNSILIGANADGPAGGIYRLTFVRNSTTNRILSFTGSATLVATAPYIDGGLWFMPNGTLAFTTYSDNRIGQITRAALIASTPATPATPAAFTSLTPINIDVSTGTATIIPPGFPGAGTLAISSYNTSRWFTLPFSPADAAPNTTYTFSAATAAPATSATGGGPEGIFYINTNSPQFTNQSVLVALYGTGQIIAYDLTSAGFPVASTGRPLVNEYGGVYGGTRDPLTGDIFFSSYSTGVVAAVRGFGLPVLRCGPADVAGIGQFQGFDGVVTADDIIVFLSWYFNSDARADIAGPNQSIGANGQFTADDIIVFLGYYFAGC